MALFWGAAPRTPSPILRLAAGQSYVPPQGWYWVKLGPFASVQTFDPIAQVWRYDGDDSEAMRFVYFDGQTSRISNPSGCAVAAVVTTAGSGYTTAPSVTPSAGGSAWTAIIGGAISTASVISAAGSGYQYPPMLWIEQPPQPGVQATGYTTISNGSLSAVTIDGQGAGYVNPPNVAIINDPRDTTGGGGIVVPSLTGAGTVTAVLCNNIGSPITSGTVPTLTFGSGSGAATAVMDWGITAATISTAGAGYTSAAGAITATAAGGFVSATPAYLGDNASSRLQLWRQAAVDITTNASGGLSAVAAIIDPGRYQSVPSYAIQAAAQSPSTVGVLALTMGGAPTSVFLMPAQL